MKRARQNKILDLISRYEIDKQEELLRYLRESGFDVTQATVSRDIRELGLVKVSGGNGRYRYVSVADAPSSAHVHGRFETIFRASVVHVDYALSNAIPAWPMPPASCLTHEPGKTWWALWLATTTSLF